MKLKHNQIKAYREQQIASQCNLCALCNDPIVDDAVLDHCHKTGLVRQVLHRGCNALLGKIENNMARNRMTKERLDTWAKNLISYINTTHTDILHPTHKTQEERNESITRKRKQNREKQKRQKQASKA